MRLKTVKVQIGVNYLWHWGYKLAADGTSVGGRTGQSRSSQQDFPL